MKVSRLWLQRYFASELPSVEALGDALTFHAFEIEGIEGEVLDVKVLPDRAGYALSHRGIAKEISAILSIPLKSDPLRTVLPEWQTTSKLVVKTDVNYVLRHTGALMTGVTVGQSPQWLVDTLASVGQRSINNIVDATNFIMLDIGQPMHAFDADKIERIDSVMCIDIREAKKGEEVTVLTGEKYILGEKMYVISDESSGTALDIAGLKGGVKSGVSDVTKNLFISVGNYDGELIRKMSQSLNLMTDASHRYQNRPSPELTAYGMRDLVQLITDIAGGVLEGVVDVYNNKPPQRVVSVTAEKISRHLGAPYTIADVEKVFTLLDLPYVTKEGICTVTPHFERTDISITEDLIEEVGRIIGYDHVNPIELESAAEVSLPREVSSVERIKDLLVQMGFIEVSTYAMQEKGDLELLKPLADDKKFLRTNLAQGHAKAVEQNISRLPLFNLRDLRLFEIGRAWPNGTEITVVGVTYWIGTKDAQKKQAAVFEQVSAALRDLLGKNISGKITGNTFEFQLSEILSESADVAVGYALSQEGAYRPFSIYPFALRDVSVWTPEGTLESVVCRIIEENAGTLLKRCDLGDVFKKDDRVSYFYKLVFQSDDHTLADTELTDVMAKITHALNAQNGWTVR